MSAATVQKNWPLVVTIGTGLVMWGVNTADVATLQREQAQMKTEAKTDHDLIVEVRTEQRALREDVREIKEAVKDIRNQTR